MQDNLSLSVIPNPFRRDPRETTSVPCTTGESLADLKAKHVPEDVPVLAYINGVLVPREKWALTFPKPGDYVLFAAAFHGGGGKDIFRSILMIVIAVAAIALGQWYLIPAFGPMWGALAVAGIMMVGGMVVNALLPPQSKPPASEAAALDSPTYSWAPHNTQQQGTPVARWYGIHKVYGNIIGSYIRNNGRNQVLCCLVNLGLGPIKSLGNFKLNDQPHQNFKNVVIRTRLGYVNQPVMEGFQRTKIEYPASVEVKLQAPNNGYIYETIGSDFDAIEVDLSFPSGIWQANTQTGGLSAASVKMEVMIRKVGTSTWKAIMERPPAEAGATFTRFGNAAGCSPPRWSLGQWVTYYDDAAGVSKEYWWDYQAGTSNYPNHTEGQAGINGMTWHWVGAVPAKYRNKAKDPANLVETVVTSSAPVNTVTITEASSSPLSYTYYYQIPDADRGRQQIRIRRISANANNTTVGGRSFFGGVREIQFDRLTYPRQALVCVHARATDQLSGSLRFSCVGEMAIVQIWDGVTHAGIRKVHTSGSSTTITTDNEDFVSLAVGDELIANGQHLRVVQKTDDNQVIVHRPVNWDNGAAGHEYKWRHFALDWSDNPAWVAYDIFTQPVIAGNGTAGDPFRVVRFDGIDPAKIDIVKFHEWSVYCDDPVPDGKDGMEKRITFNGGFDYDTTMWEAGLKVGQVGRAVPVWNGSWLTLAIDKPSLPVNMFTVGNIEESRFKETFLPVEERAAQIEIDFTNIENGYERDKLTVCRPDASNQYRASMDLFGIVKPSEAWRAGMYRLNCNKYLIRTAEIDVDIEALNAQIGDVVYIQHDVPRWGSGGRLAAASSDTVTLDKEVTIAAGQTYKLLLRLAEDTVFELQVTDGVGTYNVLHISPAFDSSATFDSGTVYHVNDKARYAGRIYQCIQQTAVPSPVPTDTAYWSRLTNCPLPEKYDLYAFGAVNAYTKRFRIMDISKSQDQKVTLSLIEYRPEVFEADGLIPEIPDYEQAALKQMEPQNVMVSEDIQFGVAGIPIYNIAITFTKATDPTYLQAEIWYAKVNGPDQLQWTWLFAGTTSGSTFKITGVELSQVYAVTLIPVDSTGNKLDHQYAEIYQVNVNIGARITGSQVRYPNTQGTQNLTTAGPSTTVTTIGDAFEYLSPGDRIAANDEARTVIAKSDSNTIIVDEEVDWNNAGAGFSFTYDAPLTALQPADQGATKGATIGTNLVGSDGETIITNSHIYGPDLPTITPGEAGLYTVQDYLGFWDGSEWKVFISKTGSFLFMGNDNNFIQWNGSALSIRGAINAEDISAGTIHADRILAGSITTNKIEEGACTAKAKGTAASYTGAVAGQFNLALSVQLTVVVGAWVLLHAECQSSARTQLIRTTNINGQIQNAILIDNSSGGFNTTTLDQIPSGSGTATYTIYVYGQAAVTNMQISVIELRR